MSLPVRPRGEEISVFTGSCLFLRVRARARNLITKRRRRARVKDFAKARTLIAKVTLCRFHVVRGPEAVRGIQMPA